jgi:hypothetical protein
VGVRRYERVCTWGRPHVGQLFTRQGISLSLLHTLSHSTRQCELVVSANFLMSP